MKENCLINIAGTMEQGDETDTVNLMTRGRFTFVGDCFFIRYEESEATGYGGNVTTVKVESQDKVSMRRQGTMPSEITIERGRRHVCHYDSGYGSLSLGVAADEIDNKLTEKGGMLKFSYTLDSGKAMFSHNQVEITVREVN